MRERKKTAFDRVVDKANEQLSEIELRHFQELSEEVYPSVKKNLTVDLSGKGGGDKKYDSR